MKAHNVAEEINHLHIPQTQFAHLRWRLLGGRRCDCTFQISCVVGIQDIETGVGGGQFLSGRAQGSTLFGKLVPWNYFLAKIHRAILDNLFLPWQ